MPFNLIPTERRALLKTPTAESLSVDIDRAAAESFGKAANKSHMSVMFAVPAHLITVQEVQAFRSFAIRTGTLFLREKLFGVRSLEHGKPIASEAEAHAELMNYVESDQAKHDLAHLVWKTIVSGGETSVPAFLTEKKQPLNETLFREEVGAGLFDRVFASSTLGTINTLVTLTSEKETEKLIQLYLEDIRSTTTNLELGFVSFRKLAEERLLHAKRVLGLLLSIQHGSFESVFNTFIEIHSEAVRMEMLRRGFVRSSEWNSFREGHTAMTERVKAQPEPICRELAFEIFSRHRDNPRVILDIVLRHCVGTPQT